MANINVGRVILGGLLAGIVLSIGEVINGLMTGEALAAHFAELGITTVPSGGQLGVLIAATVAHGIVLVWLYAAIRPRFGPGVGTALITGLVAWILVGLLTTITLVTIGLFPAGAMTIVATVWALIEFLAAAVAGAWVYQEGSSA